MYSYNWFIFPHIGQYKCSNGSIRTNRHYSRNNNWRFWSILEFLKPSSSKTYGFFRWQERYQEHSNQIVDEILKWINQMSFTECDYGDGRVRFRVQSDPYRIPYLEQLKSHLQQGYPDIINRYNGIGKNHEQLSKKIQEIMSARYKPSFQKVIIDTIDKSCPLLKNSNDIKLTQNNIFDIVFTVLYNNIEMRSFEIKSSGSIYELDYDHGKIIAKGDKKTMNNLKSTIEELIIKNEDLKKIIHEYKEHYNNLFHDDEERRLHDEMRQIFNLVKGGKPLDGSCNLCPVKPS